jgi:hypothetical protein
MQKTVEYKGFTILCGIANSSDRFFVQSTENDTKFNIDGYATLGNAKGAITKHLQATGKEPINGSIPAPKAATSDDTDKASVPLLFDSKEESLADSAGIAAEDFAAESQPASYSHPATNWPFGVHVKLYESRNKLEGRFTGREDGKAIRVKGYSNKVWSNTRVAVTRKQRKAEKLRDKAFAV